MHLKFKVNSCQHRTPLCVACECGCIEAARLLVDLGAEINGNLDHIPLMYAVSGGIDMIEAVLEMGADVCAKTRKVCDFKVFLTHVE